MLINLTEDHSGRPSSNVKSDRWKYLTFKGNYGKDEVDKATVLGKLPTKENTVFTPSITILSVVLMYTSF